MKEVLNEEIEEIEIKNQILMSAMITTKSRVVTQKRIDKELVVQPERKIQSKTQTKNKKVQEKSNKKIIKSVIISVIIIIFLIVGLILGNNLYLNNKICSLAKAQSNKVISVKTYMNNVSLQKNAVQAVKESNKDLQIEYNGNLITISSKEISENLKIGLNTKNNKKDIQKFNGKKYFYIENAPYTSVSVKLPEYLRDKKVVDIYTVKENNEMEIYKKSARINENKTVTIDFIKNVKGYVLIYVPLENILVEEECDKICINQNVPTKLNIKCVPEDATAVNVKYLINRQEIMVDEQNRLIGTKNGTYAIKVTNENNEVEKEVQVNVIVPVSGDNATEPTYVEGILIANKSYKLPKTYNPGLQPEVKEAFKKMKTDAAKEKIKLYINSDFRSYNTQAQLYKSYVARSGQAAADTFSAKPGYSEHQTGLALDVNTAGDAFRDTVESNWLAKNAYKYGFIIRYPLGKESITGYKYEPWHIRYIGVEKAKEVYDSGLCLEEFLGITSEYQD